MLIDPMLLERLLVGGLLASLAVAVAFGPELGRAVARLRNRAGAGVPANLGAEPQL
jgi:hypothetical protein